MMNSAFEALNEPATRTRRATAPARDYTPTPAPEPFPDVQHGLEPVTTATFQPLIKKDLAKIAPELGEIVRLAEREAGILEAAAQFSPESANADHASEIAGLRANLNIERLKSVGTIEDRRKNYQAQASGLRDEAEKVRREAAPRRRDARRKGHSDRDRLAVQQALVTLEHLDGMSERMAEVQNRPKVSLVLVDRHHPGLQARALVDDAQQQLLVAREHTIGLPFEQFEEPRREDRAGLHHLGEAGAILALRQRQERPDVGEHEARLVEGPDEVLAAREVDRRLATDRRVDLRDEGRRNLREGDAAQPGGGGEAGDVAHHAAAERQQRTTALDARLGEAIIEFSPT